MSEKSKDASPSRDACVLYIDASASLLPFYRQQLRDGFAALYPGAHCLVYSASDVRQAASAIRHLPALQIVCFCNDSRREVAHLEADAKLLARLLNEHRHRYKHALAPWVVLGNTVHALEKDFAKASVEARTYSPWMVIRDWRDAERRATA
jgi:hypothetical protein